MTNDVCPRCYKVRPLRRSDHPGQYQGKLVCLDCDGELRISDLERRLALQEYERANMTPEERRAQAAKDGRGLYG